VLGHVQSSADVCWYAARGGVVLFLACCRVVHIQRIILCDIRSGCYFLLFSPLSQIIVEA
jgi:hypothetical protein